MWQQPSGKSFKPNTLFISIIMIFSFAGANTPQIQIVTLEDTDSYDTSVKSYLSTIATQAEEYFLSNNTYGGAFESVVFSSGLELPKNIIVTMGEVTNTSYVFSAKHATNSEASVYCVSNGKGVYKKPDTDADCQYEKVVCYNFNTPTKRFLSEVAIQAELYYLENRTYEGALDNILIYGSRYYLAVPANITLTEKQLANEDTYFYTAKHSDPSASTFYVSPATGVYQDAKKGC